MRTRLLLAFVFAVVGFSTSKASALSPIPTYSGDYCLDQAIYFIQNNFRHRFVIEDITRTRKAKGDKNQVGIKLYLETNLCEGELVFRFPVVRSRNCSMAHYISVPDYLESVYATDACKNLVSGVVYPSDAEIRPPRATNKQNSKEPYQQY